MPNTNHIYLLSEAEIADLYARPDFNDTEKTLYFTLNELELAVLNSYTNTKTRVYFILQLGYFKAKQQFFKFEFEEVGTDVEYILTNFFNGTTLSLSGRISRNYIDRQKHDILKLLNYQDWSLKYKPQIESHICTLLRFHPKGHNALRELLSYFDHQQIVIPSYRQLQILFTAAFSSEEERLNAILLSIPDNEQKQLSELIKHDGNISQLNIIRADQKNFKYTAVREEAKKAQGIAELYKFVKIFIPMLKLSKNAVRYYADVVELYPVARLRKLGTTQQWLYAMCFIYHRYQQIMDNLVVSFMYHINSIVDASKIYVAEAQLKHNLAMNVDIPKLVMFLHWFPSRNKILTYDELNKVAYEMLPEVQFPVLAEFLQGSSFNKKAAEWEYYLKSSRLITLYLRPILLDFGLISSIDQK